MKKFLAILFITGLSQVHSQTWKYKSGGNDFDGKYKTSYVQGKGNEFPYKTPVLAINKFDKNDDLNFYISSAGYFTENTGVSILWVFDNEPETIYSTYNFSCSNDGKSIFFQRFNNPQSDDKISVYEFIEKLKLASKVSVRISNDYGKNDMSFSLSGSTKAINFVLPNLDDLISEIVEIRIVQNNINQENQKKAQENQKKAQNKAQENQRKVDKLLEGIKPKKLSETSFRILKSKIEDNFGLGILEGEGTNKNYMSIEATPKSETMFISYGYVDLHYILEDGSKELIYGTYQVDMDSPLFQEIKQKEKEKIEILNLLLEKYSYEPLRKMIADDIISVEGSSLYNMNGKFKIENIKQVLVTIKDYSVGKFWMGTMEVQLIDGNVINRKLWVSRLQLTKKILKTMGGTKNVPF